MCVHDKHLGNFKKILTISFEIFITAINKQHFSISQVSVCFSMDS